VRIWLKLKPLTRRLAQLLMKAVRPEGINLGEASWPQ
jgi:hypothetical protein